MSRKVLRMATTEIKSFKLKKNRAPGFWQQIGVEDEETTVNEAVHQGFRTVVYTKLSEKVELSQNEFYGITRIPVSTLKRRMKNDERFTMQESDAMYRLALLLKLATELFDDEDRAKAWIKEKAYGLGGKTPLEMIATTADFEIVKDLIGRVEHGVFS